MPFPSRVSPFIFTLSCLASAAVLSACSSPRSNLVTDRSDLAERISKEHNAALFGDQDPYLVDQMSTLQFLEEFGKTRCNLDSSPHNRAPAGAAKCNELYSKAVMSGLIRKYFAADRATIESQCKQSPLGCQDPRTLESWIRTSHNQGIEASRKEKLKRLEAAVTQHEILQAGTAPTAAR